MLDYERLLLGQILFKGNINTPFNLPQMVATPVTVSETRLFSELTMTMSFLEQISDLERAIFILLPVEGQWRAIE
jgi:hypothetical protein